MQILLSIIINAFMLFLVTYLMGASPEKGIEAGVALGCGNCASYSIEAWKTYIIGGFILGIINLTIRPVLKILSIPLFFLFFGLAVLIINAIILWLLNFIVNDVLVMSEIGFTIKGAVNFIIATGIFTVLNILYSILFSKK